MPEHGEECVMGIRDCRISSDGSLVPVAISDSLATRRPSGPGAFAAPIEPSALKGRRPGTAKRSGFVRASTPLPARALAERGAPSRLLALVLLAAAVALWAVPALAQTPTVTISLTGSVNVTEGDPAAAFSITVSNVPQDSTANTGALRIEKSGGVTTGDFNLYDSDPSMGSPTALSLLDAPAPGASDIYHVRWNGVASIPATDSTYNYWIEVPDDSALFEGEESIKIAFVILGPSPSFSQLAGSATLTLNVTDSPLPDPTGKPTAPANLMATAGKGAVTLTWDAIDDTSSNTNRLNDVHITKHQVRQTTDSDITDETWTDIPNSAYGGVNAASYTIGSLTDGTEYTFQVRAVNGCTDTTGCGNSDPATAVMETPDADALARPTGLMATAGNTQVTLNWTDPGDATITFYEYQQRAGTAPFGPWTEISGSTAATTSYRFTGLDNGTAYGYRLRAGKGDETSLGSDAVTVTPQGVPPAAPVLTAMPRSGGVTLTWPNPVDASLRGWEYQYKIGTRVYQPWQTARELSEEACETLSGRGGCNPPYLDTGGATLQFWVGGLTNGTPHTFRIRAVNADGTTTSNEASATPVGGVPAKPTGLTTRLQTSTVRLLEWDPIADASILRYEFTVDEGRTWPILTSVGEVPPSSTRVPSEQFLSGYTFRIRAVNAAGPGPASDPAVDAEAGRVPARNVSLEWDAATSKATLVWDETDDADLRWWSIYFNKSAHSNSRYWDAQIPVGTTRYEIPTTFNAGATIYVWISGCVTTGCGASEAELPISSQFIAKTGALDTVVTGFSVTPGDAQFTLSWNAPTDSGITHFEYVVWWEHGINRGVNAIPDGDDADSDAGNETSHTVTAINNASHVTDGTAPVNGERYGFRLRAANADGAGPWTQAIRNVMPLAAGVPAAPSGVVTLISGPEGDDGHGHGSNPPALTTWDDPLDPSITKYQRLTTARIEYPQTWFDLAETDATTTGVNLSRVISKLRAVNVNGAGPWAEATVVVSPAPARPAGLQAAPANGRVTLTWNDPGKGVYVEFYRYTTDGGATWTEIPGSETSAEGHLTRFVVPRLTNGTEYTFAIQAENDSGTSPPSAAVTATPQAAAPSKPTGLSAAPGNAEATLTWDNPGDASITKYQVKQDSGNWADISGSDASTTSHTVESLTNGTAVTFQIRAVNDHDGDSTDDPGTASDAVTVTPGAPEAPASLGVAAGNAQATLTWTAPASNNGSAVTGYEYTSNADAATPTWTDVPDGSDSGTDRHDETEYTVTSLTNNTVYAFAVRAENANGQGAATPTLRAVPAHPDAPQRPAQLMAIPGHEEVKLTWGLPYAHHPVTSYQYRQSTNGGTTWSPDWTTITDSDANTTEHTLTSLTNDTTHTFELRALKDSTAGPAARTQATPSAAAAKVEITPRSSGELTTPDGSTYTVTRLSPPGRTQLASHRARHHGHRRPHVYRALLAGHHARDLAALRLHQHRAGRPRHRGGPGPDGPGAGLPGADPAASPGSRQPAASAAPLGRHDVDAAVHHLRERHGVRQRLQLLGVRPGLRGSRLQRGPGGARQYPGADRGGRAHGVGGRGSVFYGRKQRQPDLYRGVE